MQDVAFIIRIKEDIFLIKLKLVSCLHWSAMGDIRIFGCIPMTSRIALAKILTAAAFTQIS
jgi:hypothetical protein